jgi:hypothetical protein
MSIGCLAFLNWEAPGPECNVALFRSLLRLAKESHCLARPLAKLATAIRKKLFKPAPNCNCTSPFASHVEARDNSRRPNPAARPKQQRAQPERPRQPRGQRLRELPAPLPFTLLNALCQGFSGILSVNSSILQDPGSSCDAVPFYDLQWGSPLASYGRRKVRS